MQWRPAKAGRPRPSCPPTEGLSPGPGLVVVRAAGRQLQPNHHPSTKIPKEKKKMTVQDLSGTTAIVTGASRGFGRPPRSRSDQAGAQVIGVAQHKADLDEVRRAAGRAFVPVAADAATQTCPGS